MPGQLTACALAGAATGLRAFTGVGALTLAARDGAGSQPDSTLARPWAKAVAGLLAAQECVLDKLPAAPSRLAGPGAAARLAGAAAAGVIIAGRSPRMAPAPARLAACIAVAAGAAAGSAWLGLRWRQWAGPRTGHDWIAACLEDATAAGLATAAAWQAG